MNLLGRTEVDALGQLFSCWKGHCWHINCRIHFVVNYLGIYYTIIDKIEKKISNKKEIGFFYQLDKKLSSCQTNRLLPSTSYTHIRHLGMKPSLYLSIPLLIFQYLSQFHDHGCWITRWFIVQSFTARQSLTCLPIILATCHFLVLFQRWHVCGFLSLYLFHRCYIF